MKIIEKPNPEKCYTNYLLILETEAEKEMMLALAKHYDQIQKLKESLEKLWESLDETKRDA